MRILRSIALLAVVAATFTGLPSQAAGAKQVKGVIHAPMAGLGSAIGAGGAEGQDVTPARQTCPGPSALDGVSFKFFDLKGEFKKFLAQGPKPVVSQQIPGTTTVTNEYDIDVYVFDAKCKRIKAGTGAPTGTSGAGIEKLSVSKPARYAVIAYYSGPYVDLPVTLQYS